MRAILIAVGLTVAVYAVAIGALYLAGRRSAAKEVAALLPNFVLLFKGLIADPRVPRGSKALLVFGVMWVASPIDLIPEFIPLLGPLDDAVVVALVLRRLLRTAGPEVVTDHWRGDPTTLERILRLSRPRSKDPNR